MKILQLRRRVREMREARVVVTTQKPEQEKTAVPKKDLNNLQSFPRGMECVDPLKLGYFCSCLKFGFTDCFLLILVLIGMLFSC